MDAAKRILFGLITLAASGAFFAAWQTAQGLGQCRLPANEQLPWLGPPERSLPRSVSREVPAQTQKIDEGVVEAEWIPVGPAVRRRSLTPAAAPISSARPAIEPEDAVRAALRSKRAQFEYCYQRELKKQAAFSGFVVVALSVSAQGRVTNAHVQEGNPRDALVGGCIAAQLRTLKLPVLSCDADLLIPIRLEAKDPS